MLSEHQVVNKLPTVQKAARKAIESTYVGVCTILERREVRDEKTKITRKKEEVSIIEKQPCKLSFEKLNIAVSSETAAAVSQSTKLFLAPEIIVKGGSKIVVTQEGVTTEYCASGKPAIYSTHQEIMLDLFRGWV